MTRLIGYVVREGKAKGKGRYYGRWPHPEYVDSLRDAYVWDAFDFRDERELAAQHAKSIGGRVVRVRTSSAKGDEQKERGK